MTQMNRCMHISLLIKKDLKYKVIYRTVSVRYYCRKANL